MAVATHYKSVVTASTSQFIPRRNYRRRNWNMDEAFAQTLRLLQSKELTMRSESKSRLRRCCQRRPFAVSDPPESDDVTSVHFLRRESMEIVSNHRHNRFQGVPGRRLASNATWNASDSNTQQQQQHKPSTVAVVFGFILVVLCTALLCFYIYIFYKKRRKYLLKKSRMAGITASPPFPRLSEQSPSSKTSVLRNTTGTEPLPRDSSLRSSVRQSDHGSSEDGVDASSGYEGIDSGSDSDELAKELKLAATLDQQAWETFVRRKSQFEQQQIMGQGIPPPQPIVHEYQQQSAPNAGSSGTMQEMLLSSQQQQQQNPEGGVKIYGTTGTSSSMEGINQMLDLDMEHMTPEWLGVEMVYSFPYGDEIPKNSNQPASQDSSMNAPPAAAEGANLEWAKMARKTTRKSIGTNGSKEDGSGNDKSTAVPRSSDMRQIDQHDNNQPGDDIVPTTADEQRSQPSSNDHASPRKLQSNENIINTRDNSEIAMKSSGNEMEERRINSDSGDMIKEVERLSKFVKQYEEKKEKRLRRSVERQQQRQSHPSNFSPRRNFTGAEATSAGIAIDGNGMNEGFRSHLESSVRTTIKGNSQLRTAGMNYNGMKSVALESSNHDVGIADTFMAGGNDDDDMPGQPFGEIYYATDGSTDSDTDLDLDTFRLGINPFSVQNPLQLRESVRSEQQATAIQSIKNAIPDEVSNHYKVSGASNTANDDDSPSRTAITIGQRAQLRHGVKDSILDDIDNIESGELGLSSVSTTLMPKKTLSSLRYQQAIVDTSNSDIVISGEYPIDSAAASLLATAKESQQQQPPPPQQQTPKDFATIPIPERRKRNSTTQFSNIVTMFDSPKAEAIFPPNESWQFNS